MIDYKKLSNTRGASLLNLSQLCNVLASKGSLSVKELANNAIEQGVFPIEIISTGARLPTRIHHHMIALRMLELVRHIPIHGHVYYELTQSGSNIAEGFSKVELALKHVGELDNNLKSIWRTTLASSRYVRFHWLKYFMPFEDFSLMDLINQGEAFELLRVPMEERGSSLDDSGYRILSKFWAEEVLNALAYREIYQGIRRWTTQVFLTDDRLPEGEVPYSHQLEYNELFVAEIHLVRAWLSPVDDLSTFEKQVDSLFDAQKANRITMPVLLVELCEQYQYSKFNVRELLLALYYYGNRKYFFERGSAFLIHQAFDVARPEDYYIQIEGVWRTGLVRQ